MLLSDTRTVEDVMAEIKVLSQRSEELNKKADVLRGDSTAKQSLIIQKQEELRKLKDDTAGMQSGFDQIARRDSECIVLN
jgi:predicted  nucleic acid-binding Zn-ribbon protein